MICESLNHFSVEEIPVVLLGHVSSPSFSPVSGTFPVLLQLPNGQTMPVAIPASITSSSVHIPTTIPVSHMKLKNKIRLFFCFFFIFANQQLQLNPYMNL